MLTQSGEYAKCGNSDFHNLCVFGQTLPVGLWNSRPVEEKLERELAAMTKERDALRQALSQIATNLGNGSVVSPDASLEFITTDLANEVKVYCESLRRERDELRKAGSAFHLYVRHGFVCACSGRIPGAVKCTCGLDQALAAWSKLTK